MITVGLTASEFTISITKSLGLASLSTLGCTTYGWTVCNCSTGFYYNFTEGTEGTGTGSTTCGLTFIYDYGDRIGISVWV